MAKFDFAQQISDQFIRALENGENDKGGWIRPWQSTGGAYNVASKKTYRGINTVLLGFSGYSSPVWGTLKQFAAKGYVTPKRYAQLQHGKDSTECESAESAKSTGIVFWKFLERDSGKKDGDGNVIKSTFPLMRSYFVLNAEQMVNETTGDVYPSPVIDKVATPEKIHETAHATLQAYCDSQKIAVTNKGDRAFYVPSQDCIQLPLYESFHNEAGYLATWSHESVHSTGHESRLNRDLKSARFGNDAYAYEELIAEIGAAMVCSKLGVESPESIDSNHVKYVASWLRVMKGNKNAIISASQSAQKACDLILPVETD